MPLLLEEQGILDGLLEKLELERQPTPILDEWRSLAALVDSLAVGVPVSIAVVGKYTSLGDAYLSVTKVRRAPAQRPRRYARVSARECGTRRARSLHRAAGGSPPPKRAGVACGQGGHCRRQAQPVPRSLQARERACRATA